MIRLIRPLLAAALGGAAFAPIAACAAGTVQLNFVEPATFADAGRTPLETGRTTRSLADFVQKRLAPQLPDGQVLTIDVTDIDLAGESRFTSRGDIRVVRGGADWPRISLRWTLADGGRTVKQGDERLADMDYLMHVPRSYGGETDLPYEKRLLADWFRTHIVNPN